jgi:hypoxanthine phosphoribosyltransferase
MPEKVKCEMRSWENVYDVSRQLAELIKKSGFEPDIIIGLARGGWVPARNLCDFLGVKDLVSLKMEHWGITATPDGEARVKFPLKIDLTGKKVLVVDDCSDTGKSLVESKKYIRTLNPKAVKSATMQIFDTTPAAGIPDFYVEKIPWVWVIYPWNMNEDLINLISQLLDKKGKMHLDHIRKGLEDEFEVSVDAKLLKEIMLESERRKKVMRIGDEADHWVNVEE